MIKKVTASTKVTPHHARPTSPERTGRCVRYGHGYNYSLTSVRLPFDRRLTPIRLQFDRATTVRRPTLRP